MTTALDPRQGRIAVVIGGAGAIGTAITRALHGTGHRTVVLDRDGDIACDLSSEASTRAAAAAVLEDYRRCDVFVHRSCRRLLGLRHSGGNDRPGAMRRRRSHHEVVGTVPPPLGRGMRAGRFAGPGAASLSAVRWQYRSAHRRCGVADEECDHISDRLGRDRVGACEPSERTQACRQAGERSSPDPGDSLYRDNAGPDGIALAADALGVRAPLTVRALAWYREGRCQDWVTDARVSGVHIKAGR